MIALVKLYKRASAGQDGSERSLVGAQPYAIIENERLININEDEILNNFPNNGKVYVPEFVSLQGKEAFRIFELQESHSYNIDFPGSIKYTIKKEATNYTLNEIIDIDESIEDNGESIIELLRKGISIPYHVSNMVLLRTANDMLVGPIQLEFFEGSYYLKEKDLNFISYYKQELDILKILNYKRSFERLFSIDKINEENLEGWIDVATNQRIISETINQIKDHIEFSGLSRKIISKLKEIYLNEQFIKEEHLKLRFKRILEIMENRELDDELINEFTQQLIQLPIVNEIIVEQTKNAFESEYASFVKNNRELISENNVLKKEFSEVRSELKENEKKLKERIAQLEEFEKTVEQKIEQITSNLYSVYIEQVLNAGLPIKSKSEITTVTKAAGISFSSKQSDLSGTSLYDFNDVKSMISGNLEFVKGKDKDGRLAATLITASIINEPIIVHGINAFDFAQMLAKSVASEEIITFIPEIETFNLQNLHEKFIEYNSGENTKAFIIHDPHLTTAVYSLSTYLKQIRWSKTTLLPNLIIISIEDIEDAKTFTEKMPKSPLINADNYFNRYLSLEEVQQILPGQMKINSFKGSTDLNTIALKNKFISWLNENEEVEVNNNKVNAIILWLNYMNMLVTGENLFEWTYEIFKSVITLEEE